jgi:amino acid transporter
MRYLSKKRGNHRIIEIILMGVVISICFALPVFASSVDFKETTIFKGTSTLLWAGTAALTAITVAITVFLSLKAGVAWQMAEDQEKAQKKKALIHTIAIGVLIACLGGLITLVLGAYGLSDGSGGASGTIERTYQVAQNIYFYIYC